MKKILLISMLMLVASLVYSGVKFKSSKIVWEDTDRAGIIQMITSFYPQLIGATDVITYDNYLINITKIETDRYLKNVQDIQRLSPPYHVLPSTSATTE